MDKVSLKDIFFTFLKVGIILIGGGYVILPILQSEIVEKRKWISYDNLIEYYALSQSLPGLIAINISIFSGYKIRGKIGALTAVSGLIFSAFWAIVAISSILSKLASNSYIQGVFWGVEIAVIVLIISAIREMWFKSIKNIESILIYFIVLFTMLLLNVSPIYIIIGAIILGVGYKFLIRKFGKE